MSIGRNGSIAQKISGSKVLVASGVTTGNTYPASVKFWIYDHAHFPRVSIAKVGVRFNFP